VLGLVSLLSLTLLAAPQDGTLDVMAYGEDAANVGRTNVMHRATGKPAGRQRVKLSPQSEQVCARKAETRARFGADDPRVKAIYRLCARAGR